MVALRLLMSLLVRKPVLNVSEKNKQRRISVGEHQPAHRHSLINVLIVRRLYSILLIVSLS